MDSSQLMSCKHLYLNKCNFFSPVSTILFLGLASELDKAIDQYLVCTEAGLVMCAECGNSGKRRDVRRHIEAKHIENTHIECTLCGKIVKTRDSLRKHMEKDHKPGYNLMFN